MTIKQKALDDIITLMRDNDLHISDIAAALDRSSPPAVVGNNILSRLFGYLGGIFIFAGLGIFIAMQWDSMSRLDHVLVTLGCGFCLFIAGLACDTDTRLQKAATPVLLMSAFMQTFGLIILLEEYYPSIDQLQGFLMVHLVMAIQQGCAFYARRRGVLALGSIYFVTGFFAIALDLLGVSGRLIGTIMGISLLCMAWAADRSPHRAITPVIYFSGAIILLWTVYEWLDGGRFEILFLGLAAGIIFLSLVAKSRVLLFLGTVALLFYLGDFIYENFRDALFGPVGLMLAGVLLIGIGLLAVKLNKKYITHQSLPAQV